jgi:hypothetical protein
VADSCVVVGAILLVLVTLFGPPRGTEASPGGAAASGGTEA